MCEPKIYLQAPLPFMGQKRRFAREFLTTLGNFCDVDVIVDLFGGSGLLSHLAKHALPCAHVVYNDFENYTGRIQRIPQTNALLARLREMLRDVPDNKRLPDNLKEDVLKLLREAEAKGDVDWLTMSASLLFSGKWKRDYEGFAKENLYNCLRQTDYVADGYLDGLEILHEDYREVFRRYNSDTEKALFLIDPPYLSTDCKAYGCYWNLADYLDVLNLLRETRYIYFTSEKSHLLELCEWLHKNPFAHNPFEGAEIKRRINHLNYNSRFEDIMLVKA